MSERSDQWRNWSGDEGCSPLRLERPRSVEELASVVGRAAEEGFRVRVVGAGHSFSDVACSDGVLIDLARLSGVLEVDRDARAVRVEAGISIRALNRELAVHGLALENLGDIDVQSIAGAISTATHGTGAHLRNIASQVIALKLVLADGSLLSCSRERDGQTFRAAVVGLGALGAIAEVTLRCVPAFTLRGVDDTAPLAATLASFQELSQRNDHFELYAFPHATRVLTRTNNRVEVPPRPTGRASAYLNDILLTNHAFGALCKLGRRHPAWIPQINRLVVRLAGRRVRVDGSAQIFVSPRLVRFTEMEYALPREATVTAVERVLAMISTQRLAVPFPIEVRTVAADDAFLSTASERDSGYVAVHMFEGMEWRPYFEAVEEIMTRLGGRPHWGKRHFQTAEQLRGRYPHWDRFAAVRARLDPHGVFANAYTQRVLGPVAPQPAGDGAVADRRGVSA
ncbi:MAG: D-arabinono-1,4-lactone oxidase, partial [Solirubrobacteraceae bacterium]